MFRQSIFLTSTRVRVYVDGGDCGNPTRYARFHVQIQLPLTSDGVSLRENAVIVIDLSAEMS